MLNIGCHLSAAKGYEHMGKEALKINANTFAFFTRNPRGGKSKALDTEDVRKLLVITAENSFGKLVAHAPYTLNPCSKDKKVRDFAYIAMSEDMERMEYTPGNYYNFHPGSHVGQGAEAGIEMIAELLNRILKPEQTTTVLLETMAGKGSEIGGSFQELARIYDGVRYPERLRVCFDTCHTYDAGYAVKEDFGSVLEEFDRYLGREQIAVFHINDSKNPRGARKDRHANLGHGQIGFEALRQVVTWPGFEEVPKILETPYVPWAEPSKKSTAPYRAEIEMLRTGRFWEVDPEAEEQVLKERKKQL